MGQVKILLNSLGYNDIGQLISGLFQLFLGTVIWQCLALSLWHLFEGLIAVFAINFYKVAILFLYEKNSKSSHKFYNCRSFDIPKPIFGKKMSRGTSPHLGCHVRVDRIKIGLGGQNWHICKTSGVVL